MESGQWTAIALADSSDNVDKMRLRAVGDAPNDPYYGCVLGASGAVSAMRGRWSTTRRNSWYYGAMTQAASSGSALHVNGGLEDTDATAVTDQHLTSWRWRLAEPDARAAFSSKIAMGADHRRAFRRLYRDRLQLWTDAGS